VPLGQVDASRGGWGKGRQVRCKRPCNDSTVDTTKRKKRKIGNQRRVSRGLRAPRKKYGTKITSKTKGKNKGQRLQKPRNCVEGCTKNELGGGKKGQGGNTRSGEKQNAEANGTPGGKNLERWRCGGPWSKKKKQVKSAWSCVGTETTERNWSAHNCWQEGKRKVSARKKKREKRQESHGSAKRVQKKSEKGRKPKGGHLVPTQKRVPKKKRPQKKTLP